MISLLCVLAACGGNSGSTSADDGQTDKESSTSEEVKESSEPDETSKKYVLATDDDFMLYSDFLKRYEYDERYDALRSVEDDAMWYYTGLEEYVEIPDVIQGEEVIKYGGMFAHNTTVKGVKSTNPMARAASGMFQFMDLTESGGVLDLTEFDVSNIVTANSMFGGSTLDTVHFGDKEFTELTEADGLFKDAAIKELDLSTLTFPQLTELNETFYGYTGENLNANIPSLPRLETISYFLHGSASVESLEVNEMDVSNVSEVMAVFGNFSLGGDSIIDISNWELPNIPREITTTYIDDKEWSINYLQSRLIDGIDSERDIAGIDLSSLDGALHLKDLIESPNYHTIKVKGDNEYQAYLWAKLRVEDSIETGENDIDRPEIYPSKERWERAVEAHERKKQYLEEFEIEVAEQ